MRTEEDCAIAALIAWRDGDVKCAASEDPPDCCLVFDGDRIAVEITQLAPLSCDAGGSRKKRTSEDAVPMRICDQMDRLFGAEIPNGLSLLLYIHGPLRDPRRFRRGADANLRALVDRGPYATCIERSGTLPAMMST